MVDVTEFLTDPRAVANGDWVRVGPVYGDLEILSRGFTDAFIDAQNARLSKAAESYGGDRAQIPNGVLRILNAKLLDDFLVLDVRNLTKNGEPVSRDEFVQLLYKEEANRLARACWEAAGRVTARSVAQISAAEGNLSAPSASG